jgi:hypothetical protein
MENTYRSIEGQDTAGSGCTNYGYDEGYHQEVAIAETSFTKPDTKVCTSWL